MKNNHPLDCSRFKELIEAEDGKEMECREYLQYISEDLVRETVIEFVYKEEERRSTSGDSDYIISCRVSDETGVECVKAYIWEAKAPQCYIFEKDTENRLRPTKHLIQAENQLLNYYHDNKGNRSFWRDFGVHPDYVYFGGIIIGCRKRRVYGDYDEEKRSRLYETALLIRKKYFYERSNIRILDWDYVLDLLKPQSILIKQSASTGVIHSAHVSPGTINILKF